MKFNNTFFQSYFELCKIRISVFATFSAIVGYITSVLHVNIYVFPLMSGVLLLACGASALNQYQDRDIDALMPRTKNRPLPAGRIKPVRAFWFALALIFAGLTLIFETGTYSASLLGLLAVLWYNGFYTWLKRKSAFAAVPGSLVGAIPVAIGWSAAGGNIGDPRLLFLCFFFFMWQVPHFWLLFVPYGEEYHQAGIPALTGIFSRPQLLRIIFSWIFSTSVSCLILATTGIIHSSFTFFSLVTISLFLIWFGTRLLRREMGDFAYKIIFNRVNVYMLLVMIILSIDNLMI